MPYKIPQSIETDRLLMEKVDISHWQSLHRYYCDEAATRFTTGKALTEGESWRLVAALIGHWEIHGYGPYTLKLKQSSEVIGVVGLWYPGDWPEPEIKWALITEFAGQGYASEAARAVQLMATEFLPGLELISLIMNQNSASVRLAEAVGAEYEKTISFRGKEALVYRHPCLFND